MSELCKWIKQNVVEQLWHCNAAQFDDEGEEEEDGDDDDTGDTGDTGNAGNAGDTGDTGDADVAPTGDIDGDVGDDIDVKSIRSLLVGTVDDAATVAAAAAAAAAAPVDVSNTYNWQLIKNFCCIEIEYNCVAKLKMLFVVGGGVGVAADVDVVDVVAVVCGRCDGKNDCDADDADADDDDDDDDVADSTAADSTAALVADADGVNPIRSVDCEFTSIVLFCGFVSFLWLLSSA